MTWSRLAAGRSLGTRSGITEPLRLNRRRLLGLLGASAFLASCGSTGDDRGRVTVPAPTDAIITRWQDDPFAQGSSSYLKVGSTPTDRVALRTPIDDTLFFAGEATSSDYPATVHGALLSGRRAAEEALSTSESGDTIVVIGAGAAGLGCARVLADTGRSVTVVEARDRIGGRIWTVDHEGTPVDLGASWIHGIDANPLSLLAKDAGQQLGVTDYDAIVIRTAEGERLDRGPFDEVDAALDRALREASDLPDALARTLAVLDESQHTLAHYRAAAEVEHEFAADLADLALGAIDEGEEFGGDQVVLPGGYLRLLEPLAEDLDLRLETVVSAIRHTPGEVLIETDQGAIDADCCVITLPLGVLQAGSVAFDPPLPRPMAAAIERLGMGLLDKAVLFFPERFWDDTEILGFAPETGSEWIEWVNLARLSGEPILMGFNAGSTAERVAALSDDEVVASTMGALRTMYAPA